MVGKRRRSWAAFVVAGFVLSGCGGGGGGSGGDAAGPVVTPTPSPPTQTPSPPPQTPSPDPAPSPSSPFSVANPFALAGATRTDQVRVDDLRVFGDSYSVASYQSTKSWMRSLAGLGVVADWQTYAFGGARATSGYARSFDRQIDNWLAGGTAIGNGDLTVVYLGYNDLGRDLAVARSDYREGIDRLVAAGAAGNGRRLFVTQLHDWSRNPGVTGIDTAEVRGWNDFVAGVANSNDNIIAVDLYTAFERVFQNPGQYGLTDVTSVDPARSSTTALYFDPKHFGDKGQELIARVYRHYLTRGWDWANSLNAGSAAAQQLKQDLDRGIVLGLAAGAESAPSGLTAFRFGESGSTGAAAAGRPVDPSRSGLIEDDTPADLAGGFGVNYRLAAGSSIGVALARYGDATQTTSSFSSSRDDLVTDAVSLYSRFDRGGLELTTHFSMLQHDFTSRAQDDLAGQGGSYQHDGRTWSLNQRVANPRRTGHTVLTPWVGLAYNSHDIAPYTAKSPYTSDVEYSGEEASEVLGSIGLQVQQDPIALGSHAMLWLDGSVAYSSSVYRDDVEVEIHESAMPGVVQSETIERDRLEQVDLSLGATLGLGEALALHAGYGLAVTPTDSAQTMRVALDYKF